MVGFHLPFPAGGNRDDYADREGLDLTIINTQPSCHCSHINRVRTVRLCFPARRLPVRHLSLSLAPSGKVASSPDRWDPGFVMFRQGGRTTAGNTPNWK